MIVVNKSAENLIVLTLTETSTLQNPYYLFQFNNDFDENNTVLFNATDTSSYCNRYNLFTIIETGATATTLSAGTINLSPVGSWTYNIYESTAQTLSISATTGTILETGKVVVIGDDNNNIESVYL